MIVYLFFIIALSFDTFIAALTYEGNKIKISLISNLIISGICSSALIFSLFFGSFLDDYLSNSILRFISFITLFGLGVLKIFNDDIKRIIKKRKLNKSFCDFIIKVYCDYKKADYDNSKFLSLAEAGLLGTVLSLDNLVSGIAFQIDYIYFVPIFLLSFFINFLSIFVTKVFSNIKINVSIVGGLIFIIIAFTKL